MSSLNSTLAADFYIGQKFVPVVNCFTLTDADRFVLTFMEQHPEIYPSGQLARNPSEKYEDEKLKSDVEM
ncbi:hypothetical protein AVEN_164213-1 [Araneus ventricosus]|uniref:Uncharacterized protein n=1 Tax=Araneus ventricosus TaxID=182803 RepID=A0A4Y2QQG7_ARAVE|nr:hypothetical protein AVEN_164213-1 [Araneus ventricosus]